MMQTFKISMPSALGNIKSTCADLIGKLNGLKLDESDIFDIKLSVEEALINAVKYGNKQDEGLSVDISVSADSSRIEVSIHDQGPGFDFEKVPDPTQNSNLTKTSGRGVFLIRHLMDEVKYGDHGNTITMIKYLKPR